MKWILFSVLLHFSAFCVSDTHLIELVESHLNEISSLEARFSHKDNTGKSYRGTLFLKRPWKLRMHYDEPSPFLLVSDGKSLIYEDHVTQEAIYLPLESSPLSFLLGQKTDLRDSLHVESVEKKEDKIFFLCQDKKNYFRLTLVFSKKERSIVGWISKDAQDNEVKINLYNIKKNNPIKDDFFCFQQKARWLRKPKGH